MEKPAERPTGQLDLSKIYPDVTQEASVGRDFSHQAGVAMDKANANLKMGGLNVRPRPRKSKQLDILGAIIIFSGGFSLLTNHTFIISIIYSVVYLIVGFGIIARFELARKVVVAASILGLVFNLLGLIGVSALGGGKHTFLTQLSILFSIVVQFTALSILTWHKNEEEFR